jgi:hypothetical protein
MTTNPKYKVHKTNRDNVVFIDTAIVLEKSPTLPREPSVAQQEAHTPIQSEQPVTNDTLMKRIPRSEEDSDSEFNFSAPAKRHRSASNHSKITVSFFSIENE